MDVEILDKLDNNQPEEKKTAIGSTLSKVPNMNVDNLMKKYFTFSRNMHTPGDFVEYVIDVVIPKITRNHQKDFLTETQESIDFIFRHLL